MNQLDPEVGSFGSSRVYIKQAQAGVMAKHREVIGDIGQERLFTGVFLLAPMVIAAIGWSFKYSTVSFRIYVMLSQ